MLMRWRRNSVPDVGPDGILRLVDGGVIAHIKLDFVGQGVIAEIDQEDFNRRFLEDFVSAAGSSLEHIFNLVRRHAVIYPDADAHGVHFRRIMQIGDGLPGELVIRDVEVDPVVGAKADRAPVDFHDLGVSDPDLQPVTDAEGSIDLKRSAGNDPPEEVLAGEAEDDGDDPGSGEEGLQLALRMVSDAEDNEDCDEKDEQRHDFADEMRDWDLPALFEIEIPDVTIDQRHENAGAEEKEHGPHVVSPRGMNSGVNNGCVKGENQAEKLERRTEADSGATFEKTPDPERDEEAADKNNDNGGRVLGFEECGKHLARQISNLSAAAARRYRRGQRTRQSHPARKNRPPRGVMPPNQRAFVRQSR